METIIKMFEKQVAKTPDNIAIKDAKGIVTYEELNKKVNQYARILIEHGVKKQDRVCLVMDHSIDMIIAILAIIKTGATYIPMEPNFPKKRINYIINESEARSVITIEKYSEIFENQNNLIFFEKLDTKEYSDTNFQDNNDSDNVVYVLYTSGTTGNPKGVMVTHENVCNYIKAFKNYFKITEQDKMLQCSVCTFDIFVEEVYPILMTGGTLIIAESNILNNVEELFELIKKERVSITSTFPYFFNDIDKMIKNVSELPDSWKIAISGGDTLKKEYIVKVSTKLRVFNTYGPTETTVCASYYEYDPKYNSEKIPVGKPIDNVNIYVLDDNLKEVNVGEVGEICIAGKGVSKGYLNLEEKTNENFIVNPFNPSERLYKTGDLGIILDDGNIDFIKRKDNQVMIMGKRVEVQEVENVMLRNYSIKNVVVKPNQDTKGYNYLTAYYTVNNETNENIDEIKNNMKMYLPEFMVPEYFVKMKEFPLTLNGKIDTKILPMIMK